MRLLRMFNLWNQEEIYVILTLSLMFRRHTFHLHLCGVLFVCFSHLQMSNKSHFQYSNMVVILIPFFHSLSPLLCVFLWILWLHHSRHFHSCCQWLSDGLPLPGLTSAPLSVSLQSSSYWPEMLCWSNGGAVQLAWELRGEGRNWFICGIRGSINPHCVCQHR